jgi:hypothetical protein
MTGHHTSCRCVRILGRRLFQYLLHSHFVLVLIDFYFGFKESLVINYSVLMKFQRNYVRFEVFTVMTRRMASSGMLRRVALVRTNVSEELSASIIRVTRICEL